MAKKQIAQIQGHNIDWALRQLKGMARRDEYDAVQLGFKEAIELLELAAVGKKFLAMGHSKPVKAKA